MTSDLTTIYIVRHGESVGNKNFDEGKLTAYSELGSTLTELGVNQAKTLAEKLKDITFDAVYSSHLQRAKSTAEIIKKERALEVRATEVLRERSKGSLKGKSEILLRQEMKELFEKYDKLSDEEKFHWKPVSDWESLDEVVTRVMTFLRELCLIYPGKTLLVVTHSNVMRSLLAKLGYAEMNDLPPGSVSNTGYMVLTSDGTDFSLSETYGIMKKSLKSTNEE